MSDTGPTHRMIDGVAVLTLRQADRPVVVLDWALLKAIDAAMDKVEAEANLKGFVLASDSRVFVAGADLKEIVGLDEKKLDEYLAFGQRVYGRIAKLPVPSVAALNGAALGGGLEIAMHCDDLIAAQPVGTPEKPAKPYLVGLVEAGLNICPGWGGTNMLPARMDPARAIEMTALGKPITVFDATEAGLIAELAPANELIDRAVARVKAMRPRGTGRPHCVSDDNVKALVKQGLQDVLPKLPSVDAAQTVARCVQCGIEQGWQAALDMERQELNRLRYTPQGKASIEAFFAKTAKA
ncbi:MAG: enoyl-CoA hydratase/isomerase family protein [Phycisphaerales bacterium]|nr:enoyl-CoA hydratase/isomerase family protein [Phycisphaerales bacterium]